MATPLPLAFGALLRRYRVMAGLTQETLAERAGLSVRAISDLERGVNRTPQQSTLLLLADALQLSGEERSHFEAAAHRRGLTVLPAPTPLPTASSPSASPEPPDTAPSTPPPETPPPSTSEVASPAEERGAALSPPILPPPLRARGEQAHWLRLWRQVISLKARGKLVMGLVSVLLVSALLFSIVPGHPSQPPGKTLCLAAEFPTTGDFASFGLSWQQAVELAVQQNHDLGNGNTLKVVLYNDAPPVGFEDPRQGANNVQDMVQNACILGLVGPPSSGVAAAEMPITAKAGLVMISPASTNPGLTLREYAGIYGYDFDQLHPEGKKVNFFRISPNDVFQGIVAADFAYASFPVGLAARSAYVVADRTIFGELIAGVFTQEFLGKGGTILGTDDIALGDVSIAEAAAKIAAAGPRAVFYGGTSGSGLLKAQLVKAGYNGPYIGTDGVFTDPDYLGQAGQAATNTYASNTASELMAFTAKEATAFVHDYHARYPGQELDGYAANAYDAAMILITVIKRLIQAGQPVTRAAVLEQVQHIQYTGVTGLISFDSNGDNAHAVLSLYMVKNGAWVFVEHISVNTLPLKGKSL